MYSNLNKKQILILEFVKNHINTKGYPPTIREIGQKINIKSTSSVYSHLNKLEELGYIKRDSDIPRGIEVLEKTNDKSHFNKIINLPLVGNISAGLGMFAKENIEDYIPLPKELVKDTDSFVLKVHGDSMKNAGILNDDYIIVKKSNTANNNQIVVALMNNESATVKRFLKENNLVILKAENQNYDPIFLSEEQVHILGIVTGIFRNIL